MIVHGVTDNDVYPPLFGASQRLFGLYRGLARRHAVRVLAVVPNRHPGPARERVGGFELLRRKAWYTAVTWRLERARLAPHFLAAHAHRAHTARLLRDLDGSPDVLMADLALAGALERRGAALRVYHAHNVELEHFERAGPALAARGAWASRLRALEGRAVATADLVVAVSAADAATFQRLYGVAAERVIVAPNGWDETALRAPAPGERERARAALGLEADDYVALFMGSDVPHNRAALARLEAALPRLGRGFRLIVVGRIADRLAGRREPWLLAVAERADVLPLLHAADAGVNPVASGGGSNVKLPAYLAAGLAVVTSAHGARGYDDLVPHVVIAEEGGEPGEALAAELSRRPRGWHAAGAAPPPALAHYAWGRIGEVLGEALERRLAGGAAATAAAAATGGSAA